MRRGERIPAGLSYATVHADMDFETYSEAGYIWDGTTYRAPQGATKKGIFAVGACAYSEHPSTEVLSLAYDLKDGDGPRIWIPGMPDPRELFEYLATGGLIEAHNDSFEYWIWKNVCHARMGWPELPAGQLRDSMAKARAFAYPGALAKLAEASGAAVQKMTEGKRLIQKFSCPRKPTKTDPRRRIKPSEDPTDGQLFLDYNVGDIKAEAACSVLCPDLLPKEETFWLATKAMNTRGCQLDMPTVNAACSVLDQALEKYNAELAELTGGKVTAASQVSKLINWLDVKTSTLDMEACSTLLARPDLSPKDRRAIQIRGLVGSAGVKKVYAMRRMASRAGKAHDMFNYHGARTGRDTGQDLQPQNLVKSGPKLFWCEGCGKPYGQHRNTCPYCGASSTVAHAAGWSWRAVDHAAEVLQTASLETVEDYFGDAVLTISGCIRGLFTAPQGMDLICSDYSSVEAVVIAMLANEQWRIEAFRKKQDIYLTSASRITGTTIEEYLSHPNGPKGHPDRQKIGKPAELGLGFGGFVNAWRQFDKSDTFSDDEVKRIVMGWRAASPAIVELWGGQFRGKPWAPDSKELFGLEGMAISAVLNPGSWHSYNGISYGVHNDVLYCKIPSGRYLAYHKPRLIEVERFAGCPQLEITFEGWNSNPKNGPLGWVRMNTFGGRLVENCIAEGTLVLTDSGWKPIEKITTIDKVYDGIDLVCHDGLLFKGEQICTSVDGVGMTPDHKVLTNEGWKAASQGPRPYRPLSIQYPTWRRVDTGGEMRVYDILNCGPRHRFVVLGANGPFIVHNCVQAVARDIMAHAVPMLESRGYECVLRVHDEIIAQVPIGYGSIFEFEQIMGSMPDWAEGWPVRAEGGWRGLRYRKD